MESLAAMEEVLVVPWTGETLRLSHLSRHGLVKFVFAHPILRITDAGLQTNFGLIKVIIVPDFLSEHYRQTTGVRRNG